MSDFDAISIFMRDCGWVVHGEWSFYGDSRQPDHDHSYIFCTYKKRLRVSVEISCRDNMIAVSDPDYGDLHFRYSLYSPHCFYDLKVALDRVAKFRNIDDD